MESFEPPFPEDQSGRLAEASLRAASEVGAAADTWGRAPLQALARLHAVAAVGIAEDDRLGRPREDVGVSARLTTLAEAVSNTSVAWRRRVRCRSRGAHDPVRPFGSVDDIVARASSRVVLVQRGVDPDAIAVPEMGLIDLGDDAYRSALEGFRQWPRRRTRALDHVSRRGCAAGCSIRAGTLCRD